MSEPLDRVLLAFAAVDIAKARVRDITAEAHREVYLPAVAERTQAIKDAQAAGVSLRKIAKALEISHQRVHQLLNVV